MSSFTSLSPDRFDDRADIDACLQAPPQLCGDFSTMMLVANRRSAGRSDVDVATRVLLDRLAPEIEFGGPTVWAST